MSSFINHPILKEMMKYKSINRNQTMLAFTTYLQFCEGKYIMWDVDHLYLKPLNIIIILASRKKISNSSEIKDSRDVYVPIPSNANISLQWMELLRKEIVKSTGNEQFQILLSESDSKAIAYKLQCVLISPTQDEQSKISKQKQNKFLKEKLLQKYSIDIYNHAKSKRKVDKMNLSSSSEHS